MPLLKPRPFVQSFFDMHAPRQPHAVTSQLSASFFFSFFLGGVAFSKYFCTIAIFSLYGEYVVRFPLLPDGTFLACDHWLGENSRDNKWNYLYYSTSTTVLVYLYRSRRA